MAASILPGGPIEIVFSFDTTGSMYGVLDEVRGRIQDMIQRLQADIPGIRIAVFAHGDYCDVSTYVTKNIDFSTNVVELCDFVKNVQGTGGGDTPECYELVLREVREKLSWSTGTNKVLVMIGDAPPHEPSYPANKGNIDWRVEIDELSKMGLTIYGVHCDSSVEAKKFFETIATKTGGKYLQNTDFSNIFDLIMSVCYREKGSEFFDAYEKEVRNRTDSKGVGKDMGGVFDALRDTIPSPVTPLLPDSGDISMPVLIKKSSASKPALKRLKLMKTGSKTAPVPKLKKIKSFDSVIPKPKVTKVASKKTLGRVNRESISVNKFALKDKAWSPWKLAMQQSAPSADRTWKKRRSGPGFRLRKLFPSCSWFKLYELAVQKSSSKKTVLYTKLTQHSGHSTDWESKLFGQFDIKTEINRLINDGFSVYVRRLQLRSKASVKKNVKLLSRYDYAWNSIRGVRSSMRPVIKLSPTTPPKVYSPINNPAPMPVNTGAVFLCACGVYKCK